nr:immunoglobulin light chain junction region [Macaca mulatta]MOW58234.1 immunoglobulin light chain junction region [Macaca mulatta]MOW58793.1 immunoglobulin light chain junction region [Macaca mulatta]
DYYCQLWDSITDHYFF